MKFIPDTLFNLDNIQNLNVSGRGGKEKDISQIFHNANRVSAALYDYEIKDGVNLYRIEIKKQANDQWFDIRKYHNLGKNEQEILMLFMIHQDDQVKTIAIIPLGRLLEILLTHSEFKRYGWSPKVIRIAQELYNECPELQFKAKLKMLPFITNFRDEFQIIYNT